MPAITARYDGQLRCTLTHGPSGSVIETDAPTDNHGKGERFSPTDLVAAALPACIMTIMGIVAERHGIALRGARGHRPGGPAQGARVGTASDPGRL